jgi:hypothetical protein
MDRMFHAEIVTVMRADRTGSVDVPNRMLPHGRRRPRRRRHRCPVRSRHRRRRRHLPVDQFDLLVVGGIPVGLLVRTAETLIHEVDHIGMRRLVDVDGEFVRLPAEADVQNMAEPDPLDRSPCEQSWSRA